MYSILLDTLQGILKKDVDPGSTLIFRRSRSTIFDLKKEINTRSNPVHLPAEFNEETDPFSCLFLILDVNIVHVDLHWLNHQYFQCVSSIQLTIYGIPLINTFIQNDDNNEWLLWGFLQEKVLGSWMQENSCWRGSDQDVCQARNCYFIRSRWV